MDKKIVPMLLYTCEGREGLSSQFAGHIWATKMPIDVDTQDVREKVIRNTLNLPP